MLDVRVYRTAFLPALVALFVAAFALQDRPTPARSALAPDAFNAERAFGARPGAAIADRAGPALPVAPPGSAGGRRDGRLRRPALAAPGGGPAARVRGQRRRPGPTADGSGTLETVVATAPGCPAARIVVLADRDAPAARPAPSSRPPLRCSSWPGCSRRVSCARRSCSSRPPARRTGFAGARAWAQPEAGGPVDAVLVLGDMAGARVRKPWVVALAAGRGAGAARRSSGPCRPRCGARSGRDAGGAARARPVDPPRAADHRVRAGSDRRRRPARRAALGSPASAGLSRGDAGWTRRAASAFGRAALRAGRRDRRRRPRATSRPSPPPRAGSSRCATCCPTGRCGCVVALAAAARAARRAGRASSARAAAAWPIAPVDALAGRRRGAAAGRRLAVAAAARARPARSTPRRAGARRTPSRSRRSGSSAWSRPRWSPALGRLRPARCVRPAAARRTRLAAGGLAAWPPGVAARRRSPLVAWLRNPYAAALLVPAAHLWLFAARRLARALGRRGRARRSASCCRSLAVGLLRAGARARARRAGLGRRAGGAGGAGSGRCCWSPACSPRWPASCAC